MSGRLANTLVAAAIAAGATTAARQQPAPGQPPPNLIWMAGNVIHEDGRLVTDLAAADFAVTDNGAAREIAIFRNDPIPIAVAVMIDVSASMESNRGLVRRAMSALTSHFQPGDRAILGAFDALSWIDTRFSARPGDLDRSLATVFGGTLPLCDGDWIDKTRLSPRREQSNGDFGAVNEFSRRLKVHGGSAIWDGAACGVTAVASDGETPRRVVVLITDAVDTMSFSSPASVVSRANQYGVMIYGVAVMGGYGMAGADLKSLAEQTGGGYFYLTGEDRVADAFTRIGDELRHQYVFGFPASGSLERRHEVVVTSRVPSTTARFRRVVMDTSAAPMAPAAAAASALRAPQTPVSALPPELAFESRPASATPTPPAAATATRTAVWDTLDRFARSDFRVGVAPRLSIGELRGMQAALRRDAPGWIEAVPEPERARRRLAVASFVLDQLYTQNDPYLWLPNQPNADLLYWASRTLQGGQPSPQERVWHLGAIALLERGGSAESLDQFAVRAAARFPDEGRFALARGIAQDLRTWPEPRDDRAFSVTPAITSQLIARYEDALARPSVRSEAVLRLGFFELRRGRVDEALRRFESIDVATLVDPVLRYWFHLLRGRALERANRLPEAIASYQTALDDVPATSARSALIAALVRARQSSAAARLAARALSSPSADVDPWTMYALPDMRYWEAITTALREAVTR